MVLLQNSNLTCSYVQRKSSCIWTKFKKQALLKILAATMRSHWRSANEYYDYNYSLYFKR